MQGGIIYEELTYKIRGILFEVHNELGRYVNEKQCGDLIEVKLQKAGLRYQRELILPESFEGEKQGRNRVDFLIEDLIVIEVKNKHFLEKTDYYQCLRYLEALNKKLAILVNFRDKHLKPRRILNAKAKI